MRTQDLVYHDNNDHIYSSLLLYCALSGGKLPLNEHVYIVRIDICVRNDNLVDNDHIYPFLHLLYCELVHSQEVRKLPLNEHVCVVRIEVCARNDHLLDNDHVYPFLHLLYCELVPSQHVSCL